MHLGTLFLAAAVAMGPASHDVAAAAEAFGTAQRAELGNDHARAADFYELADSLAPSKEALRSAAKNRFVAKEHAAAASLALALERRYPNDTKSLAVAKRILDEARPNLAEVELRCDKPCVVSANGRAMTDVRGLTHRFFVNPGPATLVASFEDGTSTDAKANGVAGETLEVRLEQPEPEPVSARLVGYEPTDDVEDDPRSQGVRRLPPGYFIAGAVVTIASATALTWSGFDVLAQNDDYEQDPTRERLDTGRRGELRTNVLIGTTVGFAVVTGVLGAFTDWRGRSRGGDGKRAAVRGRELRF